MDGRLSEVIKSVKKLAKCTVLRRMIRLESEVIKLVKVKLRKGALYQSGDLGSLKVGLLLSIFPPCRGTLFVLRIISRDYEEVSSFKLFIEIRPCIFTFFLFFLFFFSKL